jgi:hypothetical protein
VIAFRMTDFQTAYRDLETRLSAQAEADGDIYLPNPKPKGPVDNVLVCMEPSLGHWARSADEARAKISAGFVNFAGPASSLDGPLLLLVCVRRYLSPSYHITDLSKGAMLVKLAGIDPTERWNRWYPLLLEEVRLVAALEARFFAVGGAVARYLERRAFPHPVTRLLHYSRVANAARAHAVRGHEQEFERFRKSVSVADLLPIVEQVVVEPFRQQSLARLQDRQLSESALQLMFSYMLAFSA